MANLILLVGMGCCSADDRGIEAALSLDDERAAVNETLDAVESWVRISPMWKGGAVRINGRVVVYREADRPLRLVRTDGSGVISWPSAPSVKILRGDELIGRTSATKPGDWLLLLFEDSAYFINLSEEKILQVRLS